MMQRQYTPAATTPRPIRRHTATLALLVALATTRAARAQSPPLPLIDFADSRQADRVRVERGRALASPTGLRLIAEGGTISALIPAPGATWDLARYASVSVRLRNPSDRPVVVQARVAMPDAPRLMDGSQNAIELSPGETRTLDAAMTRRPDDPTYAPFAPYYMYFKGINVRDNTLDPARVGSVTIEAGDLAAGQSLEVVAVEATGVGRPLPVPFLPFVDAYGQYVHGDWPGKIRDDADFATRVEEEARERQAHPGPPDRDEYGGWAGGPKRKASGFFRVEKVDGRWWFVDPIGNLYWSFGPTGVGFGGDVTPVSDREDWFVALPDPSSPLGRFYSDGRGATYKYYADRAWRGFDVQRANLFRKYGQDYAAKVALVSHERLRSWGFNAIANWSAPEVYNLRRTPYVVPINSPNASPMRGGDGHSFQDVYDAAWEPGLQQAMERERGRSAGDPWCVGYFVDNERCIGWRPRAASVGELVLKAPATQPAKAKFVEQLRAKYETIDALNRAWTASYASWDALRDSREPPPLKDNAKLVDDCGDFGMAFCERYFKVSRDAVKSVAPQQLFLGSRLYGHTDPAVVELAGRYWDVISYNIYDNPPVGRVNQYARLDLPFLSTEWGVGSDPLQTPFRDEKLTAPAPGERAAQIVRYLETSLRHPNIVGAHFFQFRDQPLTGRPDGEATLRGFVNVADTPSFELVQASRRAGYAMYEMRANSPTTPATARGESRPTATAGGAAR